MSNSKDENFVLENLMNSNNDIRKLAENQFESLKQFQNDYLVLYLMNALRQSAQKSNDVRALAAILLRRVLLKDAVSLWPDAQPSTQITVKEELIVGLQTEQNGMIRRKLCDLVGELASGILEDGQWNELFPLLYQWLQSDNCILIENALRILELTSGYVACCLQEQFSTVFVPIFEKTVKHGNVHVRKMALNAWSMLLYSIDSESHRQVFQPIVPLLLESIAIMVHEGNVDDVSECIERLIDVAEAYPLYFKPQLLEYVEFMVSIVRQGQFDDSCRQLALEFLVCIAENAPGMCRKMNNNHFVQSTLPLCFQLMLELEISIESDAMWAATSNPEEEEEEITNYDIGLEALDRLVRAIGPNKGLPCSLQIIDSLLQEPEWLKQHVALMGLSQVLEIVPAEMSILSDIVQRILIHCNPKCHVRVAYAAINALGQLSSDHGPLFQSEFHVDTMPCILRCLSDFSIPRIQSHTAAALINYIDQCDVQILELYMEPLLGCLFSMLQDGSQHVREQAVTAVATIADCSRELFLRFYATFMPVLKTILIECESHDSPLLMGKTIECITLIGCAIGKESFASDAMEVMEYMIRKHHGPIGIDDPQRPYLFQAWTRLCKCFGADFTPYLQYVMPPLLDAATQQAEVELEHYPDVDDVDDDDDMQYAQVNDRCISIRTSVLEDKAMACRMLSCIVADMRESFFPYVEQVTKILAPLVTDSVHADIRTAAISAMPELILCVSRAIPPSNTGNARSPVYQLLDFVVGRLVTAIESEPELELIMTIFQAIKLSIENASVTTVDGLVLDPAVLNVAQLAQLFTAFQNVLGDSLQRRAVRRADSKIAIDLDEEEVEENAEAEMEEQDFQLLLAECIGGLAKSHGSTFYHSFKVAMLPMVLEMSHEYCLPSDRKFALYVIDDILEHVGPDSFELYDVVLPLVIQCMQSDDPSLRQAASYGIGVASKLGGVHFQPHIMSSLRALQVALDDPNRHDQGVELATDNAISAVGLICQHQFSRSSTSKDGSRLFQQWLQYLPLRADAEESVAVTYRICDMIDAKHELLLGHSNENFCRLVQILALSLLEEIPCTAELSNRIVHSLGTLKQRQTHAQLTSAMQCFSILQQTKLSGILI